jgi:putative ABC transport system permease protein
MEDLYQDLRYGLRIFVKNPGSTALSVLMLAVALGASAIMFSIINGVLLLPLPYPDADRLVRIYSTSKSGDKSAVSPADFFDWRQQAHSFEGITAFSFPLDATLTGKEFPEEIRVIPVTMDFFAVFGTQAALGRVLHAEDFDTKTNFSFLSPPQGVAAVLRYGLWQRRFGGDSGLIGQSITINGGPVTIAGVLPANFHFSDSPGKPDVDCWLPHVYKENENPKWSSLTVIGRLKMGISVRQAQAEMDVIARLLEKKRPETNVGRGVQLVSFHESIVGNVRPQLLILFSAVIFVLLTACANIANLLLARAAGRQKEMAVRTAIGASRLRLIRQLLTESILLCVLGGFLGLMLAIFCKGVISGYAPKNLPRVEDISIDFRTFCFGLLVALLTGVLCGVVPALRASRTDLTQALKDGSSASAVRNRGWLGNGLVTSQIALALMLLIATGLMIRTFAQLHAVPLGFDPNNLISITVRPPLYKLEYQRGRMSAAIKYGEAFLEEVKRIPEIEWAAMGAPPLIKGGTREGFIVEGRDVDLRLSTASPDYFRVLGVRLLEGRFFNEGDRRDSPGVAIINQTAAKELWPGLSPVGRKILRPHPSDPSKSESIQVVGLVRDVKLSGLEGRAEPYVYVPLEQTRYSFYSTVLLRTKTDPSSLIPSLRRALQAVDKDAPLSDIVSMRQVLDKEFADRRFHLMLISVFGALAFALATIGIYGIIAYSVSNRTQEIGIRLALGALKSDVLRLIFGQGLWMLIIGEAIGLTGAVAMNKLMSSMVFRVTTTDPLTYVVVTAVWAAVALLACYIPARRATEVDPMVALRYE